MCHCLNVGKVSGDEAGELSSGDEAPDRIHNDLSMARSKHSLV